MIEMRSFGQRLTQLGKRWGVDPEWLATIIAIESSFDPRKVGGLNNNHHGLIQWGVPQRQKELPNIMRAMGLSRNSNILNLSAVQQLDVMQQWIELRAKQVGIPFKNGVPDFQGGLDAFAKRTGNSKLGERSNINVAHLIYYLINPSAYQGGDAFGTTGLSKIRPGSNKHREAINYLLKSGFSVSPEHLAYLSPGSGSPVRNVARATNPSPQPQPSQPATTPQTATVAQGGRDGRPLAAVATKTAVEPTEAPRVVISYSVFEKQGENYVPRGSLEMKEGGKIGGVRHTIHYDNALDFLTRMQNNPDRFYLQPVYAGGMRDSAYVSVSQVLSLIDGIDVGAQPQQETQEQELVPGL